MKIRKFYNPCLGLILIGQQLVHSLQQTDLELNYSCLLQSDV